MRTSLWSSVIAWSLSSGCAGEDTLTVPATKSTPAPVAPKSPAPDTTPPAPTTPAPTTTEPPDPCLDLPTSPLSAQEVDGPGPSEEFAFDALGNVLNIPDGESAVFRTPLGGPSEVVAPFSAWEVAGVRILLDGALAVANETNGSVERVDLDTGERSVVVAGLNSPNSLAVHEDGRLYVAAYGEIVRVDLETGAVESVVTPDGNDLDGLTFSPDYSLLYFNFDDQGLIGKVSLGKDGTVGTPEVHADVGASFWAQLDGMATDACGNLFVTQVDGTLLRVTPEGEVDLFAQGGGYTTAVSFGSGVGGWARDHLYVMDRSQGLYDLEVGVDGRPEPHLDP